MHQDISLIFECFSLSQTSLVFKFNVVLIEFFSSLFIYLLPVDILCIMKFTQYLYVFFIRTSKILMRLNDAFCEGLQSQNVITFYFPWNIGTC